VRPGPRRGTSVFTYDVEVEPEGVPGVLVPVMGWWMQRAFTKDVQRLRDMVERDQLRGSAAVAEPVAASPRA